MPRHDRDRTTEVFTVQSVDYSGPNGSVSMTLESAFADWGEAHDYARDELSAPTETTDVKLTCFQNGEEQWSQMVSEWQ